MLHVCIVSGSSENDIFSWHDEVNQKNFKTFVLLLH